MHHLSFGEVERDEFCRDVLAQRQRDGMLPKCKLHPDVTTLKGSEAAAEGATGLGGGFPCQASGMGQCLIV